MQLINWLIDIGLLINDNNWTIGYTKSTLLRIWKLTDIGMHYPSRR